MRRSHIIIGGVVLLLSVALLSAAAYLLHYALQPEREAVHRPEIFCLHTGCTPEDEVTAELVARGLKKSIWLTHIS